MQWQQLFGHTGDQALFCVAADGGEISLAEFKRDLARAHALVERQLNELPRTESLRRTALYCTDTYEFCVWLFAGLAADLQLVIPANNKRATREALADIDLWLGEWPAGNGRQRAFRLSAVHSAGAGGELPQHFAGELQLFTSGSSGEPQSIHKQLPQLMAEIAAQQQQWGSLVADCSVLATVSHQHIYGMLFRLLWPLSSGRAFVSKTYVDVAALLRDAQNLAPALWVASPAQLSRRNDAWPWQQARFLSAIFSSGGPLAAQDAAAIAELAGHWPLEIYGSTETGGIGWRQQRDGNSLWSPLQDVQVGVQVTASTEEPPLLQVQSPWIAEGFATQDRVRMVGERFELLGRADQIAKIEEKRISLTQVERLLSASPLVTTARVLVLPKGPRRSRDLLGALVVPSDEGRAQLNICGKSALVRQLRAMLAPDLDGVALPRSWRMVAAIPVNQQGKSPRELLMNVFETDSETAFATPASMLPEVDATEVEAAVDSARKSAKVSLRIPRNLPCLPGHFETAPVVPGVVQIDWAVHFGKTLLQIPGEFAGMENIKFKQLLVPEERAELELTFDPEKQKLHYRFFWGSEEFSSGKLSFRHG
ncbi:AMP-binding protein [Microbulbifer bruguierae]|uniref:AMP-binding protein n=1 Tax=Microbulbifer bruguierae TaxID=3029061 RepID=A0ABY8NA15_9GAMM|nr:AMP-binding protein [Microbulbifer bruguierae]WGL15279.1 AMP-binding protein [Microbulbifer bruguierae]